MLSRVQKQLMIGGAYVVFAAAISFSIYWTHYRPTCSDGIKNGQEEGLDCGALACGVACPVPVTALKVQATHIIKTPAGDYDFVAEVYNPNSAYGVQEASYDAVFTDTTGTEILKKSGQNFYMLPGQTKYLVLTSLNMNSNPAISRIDIKNIEWIGTTGAVTNYLGITKQTFTTGATQSTFEGTISNISDFDFDMVDIGIVVFDHTGNPIATNTTNLQTVSSSSDRYFKVSWPFGLPSDARVYVEIGTNVFDNSNFLKQHGTQEKFQQFF